MKLHVPPLCLDLECLRRPACMIMLALVVLLSKAACTNISAHASTHHSSQHWALDEPLYKGDMSPSSTWPADPPMITTSRAEEGYVQSFEALSTASTNSLSPPTAPHPSGPSQPQASIMISSETDLAHQIRLATGPSTTILLLPATLALTQALPPVAGPLKLVSNGGAVLTCASSNFTALTVNASSFGMTGLSWSGCGTVLVVESSANGTDSSIVVSDCTFSGNRNDPAAVSELRVQWLFL